MAASTTVTSIELRNQGIAVLCGKVDTEQIRNVVSELLYMNAQAEPKLNAVQLVLNSLGGSICSGFMLTDIIEYSKLPVHIAGLGICASMGLLILCSGHKGHRVITQNTALLSHQYSWWADGKHHELVANRKEQDRTHERLIAHYLKHTKLDRQQIGDILLPKSDVWLSAKEAKRHGLVDKIM